MSSPIIITDLKTKFGSEIIMYEQETRNSFPTLWIHADQLISVLTFLKNEVALPYKMLYDLTAIDEQARVYRGSSLQVVLRSCTNCFLSSEMSSFNSRFR